jgi:hypothetical protein
MRTILKSLGVTLLSVASTVSLFAGDQLFDFETDPTGVPGFVFMETTLALPISSSMATLLPAATCSLPTLLAAKAAASVFPDVDLFTNSLGQVVSLPVKAFTITMDVRVGNGTRRPADGFSISFCRQNDRALASALLPLRPLTTGRAATAWRWHRIRMAAVIRIGHETGLAVCFDTWAGNFLPANGVINAAGNDIEGIYIRLDDVTIDSNPFVQNTATTRNGGCYITELNPGDPCGATVVTNRNTMQTGPWTGASTSTGDGGASDGTYNNLGWAPFKWRSMRRAGHL